MRTIRLRSVDIGAIVLSGMAMLASAIPAQAQSEYTIATLSDTVLKWSATAAQSNEYRWGRTKQELTDSLRGATMSGQFVIDSRSVTVSGSGSGAYSQYRGVFNVGASTAQGATTRNFQETCQNQNAPTRYGAPPAYIADFDLTIRERSDRLAVELAGVQRIEFVGQLASLEVASEKGVCTVRAVVELTTWKQVGDAKAAVGPVSVGPVRVGGAVKPPQKIKHVNPVYPPEAKDARAAGLVIVEATIGKNGAVKEANVVRSIPVLDAAAVAAVMQWVFTPTLLDGEPVEVIMTVTVQFTLQ